MCESNTFSTKWINENFETDGISLKLKGQQYTSSSQGGY